jgi:hypothetical protein
VLYCGSAPGLERTFHELLAAHPGISRLVVRAGGTADLLFIESSGGGRRRLSRVNALARGEERGTRGSFRGLPGLPVGLLGKVP